MAWGLPGGQAGNQQSGRQEASLAWAPRIAEDLRRQLATNVPMP